MVSKMLSDVLEDLGKKQVVLVDPNWVTGIVTKRLVINVHGDKIKPISYFSAEKMTHVQMLESEDILYTYKFNMLTGKAVESLERYLIHSKSYNMNNSSIRKAITQYTDHLKDPKHLLFSNYPNFLDLEHIHMQDIKNLNSYVKLIAKLEEVDPEMFHFIVDQLQYSKRNDLPLIWKAAGRLPLWLNNRSRLVTNQKNETVGHTSEHWLLFHKDGSVTFPELEPTKGAHISAETGRIIEVYNNPPLPMPDTAKRAIKIVLGDHAFEGRMVGVSWTLYTR